MFLLAYNDRNNAQQADMTPNTNCNRLWWFLYFYVSPNTKHAYRIFIASDLCVYCVSYVEYCAGVVFDLIFSYFVLRRGVIKTF